jgi:hypothetical protein
MGANTTLLKRGAAFTIVKTKVPGREKVAGLLLALKICTQAARNAQFETAVFMRC